MRLYGYWRSSASWRVRIALHLKGLSCELISVHLVQDGGQQHREDYVQKNPMRQVPVLELEHGTEVRRLTQSMAIIDHLERSQPEPSLYPSDPWKRTLSLEVAEICNSGMQPIHNLAVLQALDAIGQDRKAFVRPFLEKGLAALEARVRQAGSKFCVADAPSVGDICLVPQLYAARRFDLDLQAYPHLLRVEAECAQLEAFERAHPSRQPDAPPAA